MLGAFMAESLILLILLSLMILIVAAMVIITEFLGNRLRDASIDLVLLLAVPVTGIVAIRLVNWLME